VQHRMKENGALLWTLISERNAYFFIAGNSKDMPNNVIDCLKEMFQEHGKMSLEEADVYFKNLEMKQRFQCETWS